MKEEDEEKRERNFLKVSSFSQLNTNKKFSIDHYNNNNNNNNISSRNNKNDKT